MGFLLHQGATVLCLHAGTAQPVVVNPRVKVSGQQIVTQTSTYTIAGCSLASVPSPFCASATWTSGATLVPLIIDLATDGDVHFRGRDNPHRARYLADRSDMDVNIDGVFSAMVLDVEASIRRGKSVNRRTARSHRARDSPQGSSRRPATDDGFLMHSSARQRRLDSAGAAA